MIQESKRGVSIGGILTNFSHVDSSMCHNMAGLAETQHLSFVWIQDCNLCENYSEFKLKTI